MILKEVVICFFFMLWWISELFLCLLSVSDKLLRRMDLFVFVLLVRIDRLVENLRFSCLIRMILWIDNWVSMGLVFVEY